jgi:hypothetical protein
MAQQRARLGRLTATSKHVQHLMDARRLNPEAPSKDEYDCRGSNQARAEDGDAPGGSLEATGYVAAVRARGSRARSLTRSSVATAYVPSHELIPSPVAAPQLSGRLHAKPEQARQP